MRLSDIYRWDSLRSFGERRSPLKRGIHHEPPHRVHPRPPLFSRRSAWKVKMAIGVMTAAGSSFRPGSSRSSLCSVARDNDGCSTGHRVLDGLTGRVPIRTALRSPGAFVQHPCESFTPALAETGGDLDLVGELRPVVRSEPAGQGYQQGRAPSDLIGERQWELPRDGAGLRRLPEKLWKVLRLEEILDSGRGLWEGRKATGDLTLVARAPELAAPVPRDAKARLARVALGPGCSGASCLSGLRLLGRRMSAPFGQVCR